MSYILKIFKTGAISKSPRSVINKIVLNTKHKKINSILEFGAGKGEITEAILSSVSDFTTYDAFELDKTCVHYLSSTFKSINIINKNALHFTESVNNKYDLIICSLPLSFFSETEREKFYADLKNYINKDGTLIILFTAFWLKKQLSFSFKNSEINKASNIPPYFILTYKNANS